MPPPQRRSLLADNLPQRQPDSDDEQNNDDDEWGDEGRFTFYVCCKYSNARQTNFITDANTMTPDQTALKGVIQLAQLRFCFEDFVKFGCFIIFLAVTFVFKFRGNYSYNR